MQSAVRGTALVGAFVAFETYKPLLLQRAWIAAAALVATSAILTASTFAPMSAQWTRNISLLGAIFLSTSALIGWFVCNNKKDDLVQKRAIARFNLSLIELEAAEGRLRGALDAMVACDSDMQSLTDDIQAQAESVHAELERIRKYNEKAVVGTRRLLLNRVLVALADVDCNLSLGKAERQRLLRLVANTCGRDEESFTSLKGALQLEDGGIELPTARVLDLLEEHRVFDLMMGIEDGEGQE